MKSGGSGASGIDVTRDLKIRPKLPEYPLAIGALPGSEGGATKKGRGLEMFQVGCELPFY